MENNQYTNTEDFDEEIRRQEQKFMGNHQNASKKSKVDRTGKKFDSANHELQKQRDKASHN